MLNEDIRVLVHPCVPLAILNLYARDIRQRKVGSLFGHVHLNHVEVTSIHPVLERNNDKQFQLDMDGHRQALQSRRKAGSSESVLGAFITSSGEIDELPYMLTLYSDSKNGFLSQGCLPRPFVLTIDPTLAHNHFNLKAYFYSNPLKLSPKFSATPFEELPVRVSFLYEQANHVLPLLQFIEPEPLDFSDPASTRAFLKSRLQAVSARIQDMQAGRE
jgi:hypothetical protein